MEIPAVTIAKDISADAGARIATRREFFNTMVEHGAKVPDWREASTYGHAKSTGVEQYLRLTVSVVERQGGYNRTKRARG